MPLNSPVLCYFYPRSPCGERPAQCKKDKYITSISIHALLAESDCSGYFRFSRLDAISIHALLAESDTLIWDVIAEMTISIHALLAESDPSVLHNFRPLQISIHALLAESDEPAASRNNKNNVFLSTLSLRRATSRP